MVPIWTALWHPVCISRRSLIQGQYLALDRRTDGKELLGDVYTPDRVEYYAVTDANTKVQMFEKGELSAVIANQPAYDGYSGARYVYTADNMGLYLNSVSPEARSAEGCQLPLRAVLGPGS